MSKPMQNAFSPMLVIPVPTVSYRRSARPMVRAVPLALVALLVAGCDGGAPPPQPEVRPVRVVTVEHSAGGEMVSLTGTVQAQTEVNLAFRIDGRMVERLVNVGDTVQAGPGGGAPESRQ